MELVSTVDGATGAIIVAVDGEAVQWFASTNSERLRLRGAYIAVVMQGFRTAASRSGLGPLKHAVIAYDRASLLAQEIDDDCYVVLELKQRGTLGRAAFQLRTAAAKLRDEIRL